MKVILPKGAMGANEHDSELDAAMRTIAVHANTYETEWADKYGTNFENGTFSMRRFCWCEKDSCPLCNGTQPNFHHKPSGFKVRWYKYIGRGMETEGAMPSDLVYSCLKSIEAKEIPA